MQHLAGAGDQLNVGQPMCSGTLGWVQANADHGVLGCKDDFVVMWFAIVVHCECDAAVAEVRRSHSLLMPKQLSVP